MNPNLATASELHWGSDAHSLKSDIMARVLNFNQVTVESVHPSWLHADEVFWREHVQVFKQPEARLRVSAWLRDRFGLNGCYDHDFHVQEKRVYLIDTQAVQRLAHWLGASVCVPQLRRQLMRPQVLGLRNALGENGVRQLFSSFNEGYDTGLDLLSPMDEPHLDRLYTVGAQALLAGAQAQGEAVLRRTQLKLRRECAEVDELFIAVRDPGLLNQHVMMVTMLFLPEWIGLFSDVDEEIAA